MYWLLNTREPKHRTNSNAKSLVEIANDFILSCIAIKILRTNIYRIFFSRLLFTLILNHHFINLFSLVHSFQKRPVPVCLVYSIHFYVEYRCALLMPVASLFGFIYFNLDIFIFHYCCCCFKMWGRERMRVWRVSTLCFLNHSSLSVGNSWWRQWWYISSCLFHLS